MRVEARSIVMLLQTVGEGVLSVITTPLNRSHRAFVLFALLLMYAFGIVFWLFFFHFGNLTFYTYDWFEHFPFLIATKKALEEGVIPYYTSVPLFWTHKFLTIPESILSPQVLLLKFMDEKRFVVVNTILMYSVGFLGLLILMRRFNLSALAFAFLFLLFSLNGYIVAHLSVGMYSWLGYYLLPFFALCIFDPAQTEKILDFNIVFKLSLVLFLIFLQGSLHIFMWCWYFLAVMFLLKKRYLVHILATLGTTVALSAVRLVPGFMAAPLRGWAASAGYPTLETLLEALIVMRPVTYPDPNYWFKGPDPRTGLFGLVGSTYGWWEYDAYIGLVGFAFLVFFGVWQGLRQTERFRDIYIPTLVLTLLTLSYFHQFLVHTRIPFLAVEKVISRMIAIPLVFLVIIAAINFQPWLEKASRLTKVGSIVGLMVLLFSLVDHGALWRITHAEGYFPPFTGHPNIVLNDYPRDLLYEGVWQVSLAVSAVSLLAMAVAWI